MVEGKGIKDTYEFDMKDFVKSFLGVAKTVVTKPSEFFQKMPTTGGYTNPIIFFAVCLAISGIISAIIWGYFGVFLYYFVFGLIFSFIGAAVLHFIAQQFFEGKAAYEGMYRVVAYAGAVNLLAWIPVVGFLAVLYGFYLQIVGVEKVQQITAGQAVVTVLIAIAVYFIVAVLVNIVGVGVPMMGFRF
ncbi:MAG: YIP1 family protein [Deltaproteobacteria bacterium]|nr:YIP1 family protein [Deltaproteobacteria bacterium]